MSTPLRRPTSVQACFDAGLLHPDQTPIDVAERLLAVCAQYDLELHAGVREAYLVRTPTCPHPRHRDDYTYQVFVTTPAFLRVCRATGRWMPGTISFQGGGDERIAYATCHVRAHRDDPAWLTVGAHARWFTYYTRQADGETPTDRWAYTGDIALAEVAEVLAARKGLGEAVNGLHTEAGTMELAQDARFIRHLRAQTRLAS